MYSKRAEITDVVIGFSISVGIISWLIRKLTRSEVSHTYVGFKLEGHPFVIDATLRGVFLWPRDVWETKVEIIEEYEPLVSTNKSVFGAFSYIGKKYDVIGLFGFLFVLFFRWLGRKVRNPFASPSSYVCSELVIDIFSERLPSFQKFDAESTAPGELLEACRENQYMRLKKNVAYEEGDHNQ